jgi:hypothetical protein
VTVESSALDQQIAAVLSEYTKAWSAADLQRVADLWDEAEAAPTYVAEELAEVLCDHGSISAHLLRTEQRLVAADISVSDLRVSELAPGLALAVYLCRWQFEWVTYTRVSAVFRQRGRAWRFVHYMEAPFHREDV